LTKKLIRSKILLKLKTQKEETREEKSALIKKKLFRTEAFKSAQRILFYISFDGEVDTESMIKGAQRLGKIIAVPVCRAGTIIKACLFDRKAALVEGPYGTKEPVVKTPVNLEDLDLVIVPGIAFDEQGNRLGRGKGCYDRFLKRLNHRVNVIGVAFDFQIIPSVPSTSMDVGVGRVISA
jgi:5-formyltetrahydrofolate cyclo-ligase